MPLTHLYRLEFSIRIDWTSHFKGCLVIYFSLFSNLNRTFFSISHLKYFRQYKNFNHLSQMDYPTLINWTSPLPLMVNRTVCKKNAESDQGLHCLPISHKRTLGSYGLKPLADGLSAVNRPRGYKT